MKEGKGVGKTYVLEVIPISKVSLVGTLSYFSSEKPVPGTVVKIPIGRGWIRGVVKSSRGVRDTRISIRRSPYVLKKIARRDISEYRVPQYLIDAVEKTAMYYASTLGNVLATVLPKALVDNPELFGEARRTTGKKAKIRPEPLAIQMELEERLGHYRSVIRQSFAKKQSVLFITSSREEAERSYEALSLGIESYAFLITPRVVGKAWEKLWREAIEKEHPVLLVTTAIGAIFDRKDLKTIIIERESSRAWRTLSRPYIDMRKFITNLAELSGRELILGDLVLSLETLSKVRESHYGELSPTKWRLPPPPSALPTRIVDMRRSKETNEPFEILSQEVRTLVEEADREKTGIFLFGVRKGLSPNTVCGDCGSLLSCRNCGAPLVLYEITKKERIYVCHACKAKRSSETVCDSCGSWKLVPLGIGIDTIAGEVEKLFPRSNIRVMDKSRVTSSSQAERMMKGFEKEGGILIGTELALLYLGNVPRSAIVSLDSLFALPDFGAEERIFHLITQMREKSEREMIVQTRRPDKDVINWAVNGNIADFFKSEVEERRRHFYPPFSLFIRIEGGNIESITKIFERWHPVQMKDALVVRLPREKWPSEEIIRALSLLGPQFSIKVDPESIL